jgi:uncharacterized protein (UPF0303 family)
MAIADYEVGRTTGGFSSGNLLSEENLLVLTKFELSDAVELGEIALDFGITRDLTIAIEVRIGQWTVFHASLPGSTPENDWWMNRKARVVLKTGHSTMYERVLTEETSMDWFAKHGVSEEEFAIHGGGLPINVKNKGLVGVLLISGLPQVQDHLLGVEILTEYLARKGEVS